MPKVSEETKRKISETLKKKWQDDQEFRERTLKQLSDGRENATPRDVSEETRKKLSDNAKRLWADQEFRKKTCKALSDARKGTQLGEKNSMFGRKHKKSSKVKMSKSQKESWNREETRAKKIKALKERTPTFLGKQHSESTKELISQKAKKRFKNPEYKRMIVKAREKIFKDPKYLRKQSEARKKLWENPEFRRKALEGLSNKEMTSLEVIVAEALDRLKVPYESQKVIGRCIADFYIPSQNLIIEADGEYWHSKPEVKDRDRRRDAWLKSKGYKVVRLKEEIIKNDPLNSIKKVVGG